MQKTITGNEIKAMKPCADRWQHFCRKFIERDTPISWVDIIEHSGVADTLWVLRRLPDPKIKLIKLFALGCARRVEYLDKSGKAKTCNDATQRYLDGELTAEELNQGIKSTYAAAAAAADAADAADAAAYAAAAAAYAATAAAAAATAAYATAAAECEKMREKEREAQKQSLVELIESCEEA